MASKNNTMASFLTAKEKTGAKRVRDALTLSPVGKGVKGKGKKQGSLVPECRATLPVSVVSIKPLEV